MGGSGDHVANVSERKWFVVVLSRRTRRLAAVGTGVMLAVGAAGSVSAHVSIDEEAVEAGSLAVVTFALAHGCAGSPTTQVRIQVHESIPDVTPTINANWTVDKVIERLDDPIVGSHGELLNERVREVVYTAITPLEDGYRDTFELSIEVPDSAVGQTLYFPTIQRCEVGETAWIEIPTDDADGGALAAPAPSVLVVAGLDGEAVVEASDSTTADTLAATSASGSTLVLVDACSLVPDAEAATATALIVGEGVPGGDERRRVCTFQADSGVGITIGIESGGRFDAKAEASRQSLGVEGEQIDDVGDRALFFYSDDDLPEGVGGVLVAVGDLTIDVTMQGLDEAQMRDASVALANLAVSNL